MVRVTRDARGLTGERAGGVAERRRPSRGSLAARRAGGHVEALKTSDRGYFFPSEEVATGTDRDDAHARGGVDARRTRPCARFASRVFVRAAPREVLETKRAPEPTSIARRTHHAQLVFPGITKGQHRATMGRAVGRSKSEYVNYDICCHSPERIQRSVKQARRARHVRLRLDIAARPRCRPTTPNSGSSARKCGELSPVATRTPTSEDMKSSSLPTHPPVWVPHLHLTPRTASCPTARTTIPHLPSSPAASPRALPARAPRPPRPSRPSPGKRHPARAGHTGHAPFAPRARRGGGAALALTTRTPGGISP